MPHPEARPPKAERAAPPSTASSDVTQLLRAFSMGDRAAYDALVPLVYAELRRLAHLRLRAERPDHTLDTGALVHEAWFRMLNQSRTDWRSRAHFLAVASEAMRRILVDHAKARRAAKRGGGTVVLSLDVAGPVADPQASDDERDDALLALHEAMARLAVFNPDGALIVQYRCFGGLTNAEIADLLDTSERTVRRSWTVAKAWLHCELTQSRSSELV